MEGIVYQSTNFYFEHQKVKGATPTTTREQ